MPPRTVGRPPPGTPFWRAPCRPAQRDAGYEVPGELWEVWQAVIPAAVSDQRFFKFRRFASRPGSGLPTAHRTRSREWQREYRAGAMRRGDHQLAAAAELSAAQQCACATQGCPASWQDCYRPTVQSVYRDTRVGTSRYRDAKGMQTRGAYARPKNRRERPLKGVANGLIN